MEEFSNLYIKMINVFPYPLQKTSTMKRKLCCLTDEVICLDDVNKNMDMPPSPPIKKRRKLIEIQNQCDRDNEGHMIQEIDGFVEHLSDKELEPTKETVPTHIQTEPQYSINASKTKIDTPPAKNGQNTIAVPASLPTTVAISPLSPLRNFGKLSYGGSPVRLRSMKMVEMARLNQLKREPSKLVSPTNTTTTKTNPLVSSEKMNRVKFSEYTEVKFISECAIKNNKIVYTKNPAFDPEIDGPSTSIRNFRIRRFGHIDFLDDAETDEEDLLDDILSKDNKENEIIDEEADMVRTQCFDTERSSEIPSILSICVPEEREINSDSGSSPSFLNSGYVIPVTSEYVSENNSIEDGPNIQMDTEDYQQSPTKSFRSAGGIFYASSPMLKKIACSDMLSCQRFTNAAANQPLLSPITSPVKQTSRGKYKVLTNQDDLLSSEPANFAKLQDSFSVCQVSPIASPTKTGPWEVKSPSYGNVACSHENIANLVRRSFSDASLNKNGETKVTTHMDHRVSQVTVLQNIHNCDDEVDENNPQCPEHPEQEDNEARTQIEETLEKQLGVFLNSIEKSKSNSTVGQTVNFVKKAVRNLLNCI